jgi:cardiolipin synthase A/B
MDQTGEAAKEVAGAPLPLAQPEGQAGTSTGVNLEPGHDDDGWIVPPPVRLADGSRVQLFKDGEALHAAYEAIRHAKHRICLEVYIFASDGTGHAFADLLSRKARDGVPTYVIYDSFGSISTDRAMFANMRRAGVHLTAFHPIRPWEVRFGWRPFNRDHRKLLVIDDHIAGLGGLNVGAEYAGSWVVRLEGKEGDVWRDNGMSVIGPSARVFLKSFANTWRYIHSGGRITKALLIHGVNGFDHASTPRDSEPLVERESLGVIASVPTLRAPLAGFFQQLMRRAKRSVELTMAYFAPADEFINELVAAAKRGVRVRLMLPEVCDVQLLVTAARSFYDTLMAAGVEIYERKAVVLHAKSLVIDSEISVIGSTNLDYRSIEYNCELSAVVRSEEFGAQMHALFEHDVRYATRISPEAWRRRPYLDRIGQWAVKRARYLL